MMKTGKPPTYAERATPLKWIRRHLGVLELKSFFLRLLIIRPFLLLLYGHGLKSLSWFTSRFTSRLHFLFYFARTSFLLFQTLTSCPSGIFTCASLSAPPLPPPWLVSPVFPRPSRVIVSVSLCLVSGLCLYSQCKSHMFGHVLYFCECVLFFVFLVANLFSKIRNKCLFSAPSSGFFFLCVCLGTYSSLRRDAGISVKSCFLCYMTCTSELVAPMTWFVLHLDRFFFCFVLFRNGWFVSESIYIITVKPPKARAARRAPLGRRHCLSQCRSSLALWDGVVTMAGY